MLHNDKVTRMTPDTVLCYSDGSASPNPGPCGAGVSFFYRDPDMVSDYGASLGRGTNNYAELYGLGIIFTRLVSLRSSHPTIKRAVVFCDSKLALRAAVSSKKPITNGPITRAVRAAFLTVSSVMEIDLQWIRGHVEYGGNERVDRISKAFASVANNILSHSVDASFPASATTRVWEAGFPLTGLPVGIFLQNLPTPPPILFVPVIEPSVAPDVVATVTTHAAMNPSDISASSLNNASALNVLNVREWQEESKAQAQAPPNARKPVKPTSLPTRRSARLNRDDLT